MKRLQAPVAERGVIYSEPGIYAGWPANHGAWQWGDELLVGFMRGTYGSGMHHKIEEPYQKMLARSLDGGKSWKLEVPNVDFECEKVSPAPPFDLSKAIIRVCGFYDTGGERCCEEGGFYLSHDRGKTWEGPYAFTGADHLFRDPMRGTSRTCVLGNLVFVSAMFKDSWGTDRTYCLRHDGTRFHLIGTVCADKVRAVMPSVVSVGGRLVAALRRRGNDCWIDAFGSDDGGESWKLLSKVSPTPSHNGNPPALAVVGDRVFCAYGHRSTKSILLRESMDRGESWGEPTVIERGESSDIGYPRLFVSSDGALVCVYYWSASGEVQHIRAAIITTV